MDQSWISVTVFGPGLSSHPCPSLQSIRTEQRVGEGMSDANPP